MKVRLRLLLISLIFVILLFCSGEAFYRNPDCMNVQKAYLKDSSGTGSEPEGAVDPENESEKEDGSEAIVPSSQVMSPTESEQEELIGDETDKEDSEDESESEEDAEIVYDSTGEILKKKIKGIWYVWDDEYGYQKEVRIPVERDVETESIQEQKAQIKMTCVYQRPEYPTGCEITAAYMILKYYRFPISKVRFGNKYFEISEDKVDFRYSFVGDPYTEYGLGCYSPAVVLALNRYFDVCESDLRAYNYTGYSFESLLNEVAKGYPVIFWGTQYMKEPFYGSCFKFGDDVVQWISQEHCMVLGGYDIEKKTAYVYDPLAGPVEYDIDTVKKRYLQLGSQAVIVRNKDEYYDRRNKPSAFRDDPNLPKR